MISRAIVRPHHVLAAMMFASTEETRFYLRGVHIDLNPIGGVQITATDGHTLASIHDPDGRLEGPAMVWNIPSRWISSYLTSSKKALAKPDMERLVWLGLSTHEETVFKPAARIHMAANADNVLQGKSTHLSILFPDQAHASEQLVIEGGQFPEYIRVFPTFEKNKDATMPAFMEGRYLERLVDFGRLLGGFYGRATSIALGFEAKGGDENSPYLVRFENRQALCLVMPKRSNGYFGSGEPEWLAAIRDPHAVLKKRAARRGKKAPKPGDAEPEAEPVETEEVEIAAEADEAEVPVAEAA